MKKRLVLLFVSAFIAASGCTGTGTPAAPGPPDSQAVSRTSANRSSVVATDASPEQVVTAALSALQEGRGDRANALFYKGGRMADDAHWGSLASFSLRRVETTAGSMRAESGSSTAIRDYLKDFPERVQLRADCDLRGEGGVATAGYDKVFFTVGRKASGEPWWILDMGTVRLE